MKGQDCSIRVCPWLTSKRQMYITERGAAKIIIYELNTNCDARHVFSNLFPSSPFLSPLHFLSLLPLSLLFVLTLYFNSSSFYFHFKLFFLSVTLIPAVQISLPLYPFHASSHLITFKTFHYCILFISLTLFIISEYLFLPSRAYILLLQFPSLRLCFSFILAFSVSFPSCDAPYSHLSIEYVTYT
jgi:hypothetical protein